MNAQATFDAKESGRRYVTTLLDKSMSDRVDAVCKKLNVSRAVLVRSCVRAHLKTLEQIDVQNVRIVPDKL